MNFKERIDQTLRFLGDRKRAYQLTFQTSQPANITVLADLAKFCRANESCAVPGDRDRSLILEGRREAWLRIQQHLNLSTEQLFALYSADYAILRTEPSND